MDDTAYSILQYGYIEVEQQAGLPTAEPQVCQQLGLVYRKYLLDGLYFDNYSAIHQKVKVVSAIETQSLVLDRKSTLPLERHLPQR